MDRATRRHSGAIGVAHDALQACGRVWRYAAAMGRAVRDPNGRAYNRTAFLPERRRTMPEWADFLDRLKAGDRSGPAEAGSRWIARAPAQSPGALSAMPPRR